MRAKNTHSTVCDIYLHHQHELEKVDSVLKENKAKLKHWRKEAAGLSLSAITREEGEELTLPELSPEELAELVIQELKLAITVQEEKLAQMKPNMAAIAEFRYAGCVCCVSFFM